MLEYKRGCKGEITVFLSLITVILVSFIVAILDSAVIKTYGNKSKVDAETAIFSLFGEYQDELFNDYKILAVDSSYGKSGNTDKYVQDKLRYFGTGNMNHKIKGIELLTDENCAAFRSQVLKYKSGPFYEENYSKFEEDKVRWLDIIKKGKESLKQDKEYESVLQDLKGSADENLDEEENLFEILEDSKKSSLVEDILPDGTTASKRKVNLSTLASKRKLREGYGVTYDTDVLYSPLKNMMFNDYVIDSFNNVTSADIDGSGLIYEVEYIISGKASDKENLENVIKKIIYMRVIPNLEHIENSAGKNTEVKALSLALSVAIMNPELAEVIESLMKWMWAYTESKCDAAALMAGLKVPEVKTDLTWNSRLYDCFTDNVTYKLEGTQKGLDYKDFLKILLLSKDAKKVTKRCVDMAELNIRSIREKFKIDNCFVKIKVENNAELLKGFNYNFPLEYGYN